MKQKSIKRSLWGEAGSAETGQKTGIGFGVVEKVIEVLSHPFVVCTVVFVLLEQFDEGLLACQLRQELAHLADASMYDLIGIFLVD